jgi:FAD/FMN-containing dehydrogenase
MALPTRRHFVQQATFAAAALCFRPSDELASCQAASEAAEPNAPRIDAAAIRKFAFTISGQVITADASDYESARIVFNRAFDRRPAVIVRCTNESDIARSLEFSQAQRVPLAIRGGGHSRAGFGVCDGGVVIDLSRMNHAEVDAAKRVARAQAGCLVRDVDKATQQFGLATTMGGCPTVGIAGFTLGGGEGLLMSKFGAGCDNLLSARIVTADGRQLTASPDSNPDLFWAIRGGGGNFGVVSSLEYQLHPLTDVLAGTLTYAPGKIPELLAAFVKFVSGAPDEMNVVGEVLPSVEGPRFHMLVCHCGEPGKGTQLLSSLRSFKPQQDTVHVASYLETQATLNPYAPAAHFQTNLFLPELTTTAIEAIAAAANHAPPTTRVFIVPLYGAVSRVAPGETAFPLRQPGYELDIMGRWADPADKAGAISWVKNLRDTLQPLAHGVYSNQLGETSEALVKAAYGSNYARLAEIKKKYDPRNVLRINQNIQPA